MHSLEGSTGVSLTWYNNTLSRLFCQNDTIWELYQEMANESDKTPLAAFKKSMSPYRLRVGVLDAGQYGWVKSALTRMTGAAGLDDG